MVPVSPTIKVIFLLSHYSVWINSTAGLLVSRFGHFGKMRMWCDDLLTMRLFGAGQRSPAGPLLQARNPGTTQICSGCTGQSISSCEIANPLPLQSARHSQVWKWPGRLQTDTKCFNWGLWNPAVNSNFESHTDHSFSIHSFLPWVSPSEFVRDFRRHHRPPLSSIHTRTHREPSDSRRRKNDKVLIIPLLSLAEDFSVLVLQMHHGCSINPDPPSILGRRCCLQEPQVGKLGKWYLHQVGVVKVLEDPFRVDATQLRAVGDGDGGFDPLVDVDDGSAPG